MEVKIKGSESNVKKFLKTNSLFIKRSGLNIALDDTKEDKPEKQIRKRRTKAEIEADKENK